MHARASVVVAAAVSLAACGTQSWVFDGDGGQPAGGCLVDGDCPLPSLHCEPLSGRCVACLEDGQCMQPGLPRCDSALHRCVQCGVVADCGSGELCEPTLHRCVPSCADGGACPASAPTCSPSRGLCLSCSVDSDCASASTGKFCDGVIGQCVQCVSDGECRYPARHCDRTTDRCVACVTSADCDDGAACDPIAQTCVGGHDDH